MAYVPIPKDLTRVKTKFALGLTKRQLVCFGSAAATGLPLFFLLKGYIPISAAAFCMILVMVPWFLFALYERNGLPLENYLRSVIAVSFIRPKVRTYQTTNLYDAAIHQKELYKEVEDIVSGKDQKRSKNVKKATR